jgi:hypothetical protein
MQNQSMGQDYNKGNKISSTLSASVVAPSGNEYRSGVTFTHTKRISEARQCRVTGLYYAKACLSMQLLVAGQRTHRETLNPKTIIGSRITAQLQQDIRPLIAQNHSFGARLQHDYSRISGP